eukprot:XP_003724067.1 PREDICTED: muscarinic acetylcholine receptor M2-like [Strongylocentrotus purpuratus]
MLILYVRIFIKIRETTGSKHIDKEFDGDSKQSGHSESEDDDNGKKQRPQTISESRIQIRSESVSEVRSATKTLLFIVILFFITWFQSSLISVVYSIKPTLIYPRFPNSFHLVLSWLVYVNSLLNPLCYAISQPLFRKTVLGLLSNPMRYCRG